MTEGQLTLVLQNLRRLIRRQAAGGLADRELLTRFVRERDEAAFEALVWRHGPMVLSLCQRVLHNSHDAEDVLQATFLILVKKAGAIGKREALASWLYKVAYRIALRVMSRSAKAAHAFTPLEDVPAADAADADRWHELRPLLDAALQRLPEKYRRPIVLCYLQGKTNEEAAEELGCPLGTLTSRLSRARELLRRHLSRRGLTLSAGALGSLLAENAISAAVPLPLAAGTVKAASALAAGSVAAGAVKSSVAILVEGASKTMLTTHVKIAVAVLLATGALAAGAGMVARQRDARQQPVAGDRGELASPDDGQAIPEVAEDDPRRDAHGDPLPAGAVMRLGTPRLFHAEVNYLAFSPDAKSLATVGNMGEVRLWGVATGKLLWEAQVAYFGGWDPGSSRLAFSPDGKLFALACAEQNGRPEVADKVVRVWDTTTGRQVHRLATLTKPSFDIAFSPDSRSLASGGWDGEIALWDMRTGKRTTGWKSGLSSANLAFSADGRTLIIAGGANQDWHNKTISSWDVATGKENLRHALGGESRFAYRVSPDGKLLASPTFDGRTIHLYDARTGKEVARTKGVANRPTTMAFSGDGRWLTSSSDDGVLRVWATAGGDLAYQIKAHSASVDRVALSGDGKLLASISKADQNVHIWDVAAGKELHSFVGPRGGVLSVAFTPDGKSVRTAHHEGVQSGSPPEDWGAEWSWRQWDARSGKELRVVQARQKGGMNRAVFSPDGKFLAAWTQNGDLRLWDVGAGKEPGQWQGSMRRCRDMAFSPDGTLLVGVIDDVVRVWESATGKEVCRRTLTGPGVVQRCLIAPDNKTLLLDEQRRGVFLFDSTTGEELVSFRGERAVLPVFAISPDGRTVARSDGKKVELWEAATGLERLSFETGTNGICSLAFSPDGNALASGSGRRNILEPRDEFDCTVSLWHAATGKRLRQYLPPREPVWVLAFSPDGKALASAGRENTVLIWDVPGAAPEQGPAGLKLSPQEVEDLWGILSGADTRAAYRAVWKLVAARDQGVALLKARLTRPAAATEQVERKIADLDADAFEVREKATRDLTALGKAAKPVLQRALKANPSVEARNRIERILGKRTTDGSSPPSELVVGTRVLEVLEKVATPDARQVIEAMAQAKPESRLTREARLSLQRLAGRPARQP